MDSSAAVVGKARIARTLLPASTTGKLGQEHASERSRGLDCLSPGNRREDLARFRCRCIRAWLKRRAFAKRWKGCDSCSSDAWFEAAQNSSRPPGPMLRRDGLWLDSNGSTARRAHTPTTGQLYARY